jgi:hypothetical protein
MANKKPEYGQNEAEAAKYADYGDFIAAKKKVEKASKKKGK